MKLRTIQILALIWLFTATNTFALSGEAPKKGNGGFLFQKTKTRAEQIKEDGTRHVEDAKKRTEELNKQLQKQRKKEAKAAAKAKREAEKKKKKAKTAEEKVKP